MAKLYVYSIEELSDLSQWLADHDTQIEDVSPKEANDAGQWLAEQCSALSSGLNVLPKEIDVPEHLVNAIDWAVDDWSEVLGANHEAFCTYLMR